MGLPLALSAYFRLLHSSGTHRLPQSVLSTLTAPSSRLCHVQSRPLPDLPTVSSATSLSSAHSQCEVKDPALADITIVDSPATACTALQTLIAAADDRKPIAWHVRVIPNKTPGSAHLSTVTLSAYAGTDFDFGSGPFLFLRPSHDATPFVRQLRRYFSLDTGLHIWHDFSAALQSLAPLSIIPRAPHRDVSTMSLLVPSLNPSNSSAKHQRRSRNATSTSVINDNDIDLLDPLTADGVRQICDGAAALFNTHNHLCRLLSTMPVRHSTRDTLALYDKFYGPAYASLAYTGSIGIHLSRDRLSGIVDSLNDAATTHEKAFLHWASRDCTDNQHVDVNKPAQLRHLLFAPCRNSRHAEKRLLVSKRLLVARDDSKPAAPDGAKANGKVKKRPVEVQGLALQPVEHMNSGWPSLSVSALEGMRECAVADNSSKGEGLAAAMDDLLGAREARRRAKRIMKALDDMEGRGTRLCLRQRGDDDEIGARRAWRAHRWGDDVVRGLAATEGGKLVVLKYESLMLWAVAQLSQCDGMRERLESGGDVVAGAAMRMYSGIAEGMRSSTVTIDGVRESFPQAYRLASRVDSALKRGGVVGGAGLIKMLCKGGIEEAREVRQRWYGGHSGVEQWHAEWREQAASDGLVQTMMGKQVTVCDAARRGVKASALEVEKSMTEAMGSVLSGTAREVVLGLVKKMTENEELRALGWRVVLVVEDGVVLEGPEYSVDGALEVMEGDATRPVDDVDRWVNVRVAAEVVSALEELSLLSVPL